MSSSWFTSSQPSSFGRGWENPVYPRLFCGSMPSQTALMLCAVKRQHACWFMPFSICSDVLTYTCLKLPCFVFQSLPRCVWSCSSKTLHGATRCVSAVRWGASQHPLWCGSTTLSLWARHHGIGCPHRCCVCSTSGRRTMACTSVWRRTVWAAHRQPQDSLQVKYFIKK